MTGADDIRRLRELLRLCDFADATWDDWGGRDVEVAMHSGDGFQVLVKGWRSAHQAEMVATALRSLPALLDRLERYEEALREIAEKLSCDPLCEPRPETHCTACGQTHYENWCAGCLARRALEDTNG